MGNIKQGILGGFNGKVGTVVGFCYGGKAFMRAKALNIKNPNTLKQQLVRKRFAILSTVLCSMPEVLALGFGKMKQDAQTPINAAFAFNYDRCLSEMGGVVKMNYDSLAVARGKLMPAKVTFTAGDAGTIDASWTDNTGTGGAEATDMLNVVVFNPTKGMSVQRVGVASRQDEGASFDTVPDWNNQDVHVYAFWSNSKNDVSDNSYTQLNLK